METNTLKNQENSDLWLGYDVMNEKKVGKKYEDVDRRDPQKAMDKEAFLSLLMTQMKYQDPMNPVEDTAFIAQLAQFSSLEQMQNMNKSVTQVQSYSMLGQYVQGETFDKESNSVSLVEGIVDGVKLREGQTYLMIGEKELPTEKVINVLNQGENTSLTETEESVK